MLGLHRVILAGEALALIACALYPVPPLLVELLPFGFHIRSDL